MKKKYLLLILSLLFVSQELLAEKLGPYRQLRKVSRVMRGVDPSYDELMELRAKVKIGPAETQQFIELRAAEYLATQEYRDITKAWIERLFKLTPTVMPTRVGGEVTRGTYYRNTKEATLMRKSHSDVLIESLIYENKSWDGLITDHRVPKVEPIKGYYYESNYKADDYFYKGLNIAPQSINLATAGILTTPKIWAKYAAGPLNKNRRIAAMIFDVFLCDPMVAKVTLDDAQENSFFGKLNGFAKTTSTQGSVPKDFEKEHGSNPACQTCHYKLDPIGEAVPFRDESFQMFELPAQPSPGKIVFKRKDGKLVSIEGAGIGPLAEKLTTLPEYERCQVRHFWNEYIDPSQAPSDEKVDQLVELFNSPMIKRKINNFIYFLVTSPEFAEDRSEAQTPVLNVAATFQNAEPLLKRCHNCHVEMAEGMIDISKRQISENKTENLQWLMKMQERLRMPHSEEGAMPMERAQWTQSEIDLLIQWLDSEIASQKGAN